MTRGSEHRPRKTLNIQESVARTTRLWSNHARRVVRKASRLRTDAKAVENATPPSGTEGPANKKCWNGPQERTTTSLDGTTIKIIRGKEQAQRSHHNSCWEVSYTWALAAGQNEMTSTTTSLKHLLANSQCFWCSSPHLRTQRGRKISCNRHRTSYRTSCIVEIEEDVAKSFRAKR